MQQLSPVDLLTVALVGGVDAHRAAKQAGIPEDQREQAIRDARRRLTLAAEYNRDEQLGLAKTRLEDLYSKAVTAKPPDLRVALTVTKELARLLDLHRPPERGDDGESAEAAELRAVRAHLDPLQLSEDGGDVPTSELARLAVDALIKARHGR